MAATAVICLVLLLGQTVDTVAAQGGAGWDPPVVLSRGIVDDDGQPADGFRPVVVADDWGQVHAFWGARTNPDRGVMGNAIYYARWDEQGWSNPRDIIFVDDANNQHAVPRVAVDAEGWLHLAWLRRGTLRYSRVSVWQADDVRAWADPVVVTEGPVPGGDNPAAIVAGADGGVHVIYLLGSDGSTIAHTSSEDGVSWSDLTIVASGMGGRLVNASIDHSDRLHVVYHMNTADGVGVYYTRSEDMGATWSDPMLVDRHDHRYRGNYAPHYINVLAFENQVHIAWHGAPRSQRWHQWSDDGGVTWREPVQISPDLVFLTNPPAMAFDGSGVLHLMSVGGGPQGAEESTAVFHTAWRGGQWGPLELVCTEADERVDFGIGGGNDLVAVWDARLEEDRGAEGHMAILGSSKELLASPLSLAPQSSPAPTVTPQQTGAGTPIPTAGGPTRAVSIAGGGNAQAENGLVTSLSVAALLAALVVSVVLFLGHPWR
ncbi:MAG: sialidase family protein [Chloroflexota bacterium]|nr:sialidase family protein [Chloroflexota bacterium]